MEFIRQGLEADGFRGFRTIETLMRPGGCNDVPADAGVYVVLREDTEPPEFLEVSCGGRYKDRDPTVTGTKLRRNWIDGAQVVYIGKTNSTLQRRICEYIKSGMGCVHNHWGGRLIWQLSGVDSLVVAWKTLPREEASVVESHLLHRFKDTHDERLPFANLRLERRRGYDALD